MIVDWTDEMKDAFVRQQFTAQHAWYQEHYQGATFDVVLIDGIPAGRLYVHRRPDEIRLRDVLAEGEAVGKPVTIHVEVYNPAMRLYERLGFKPVEDRGVYYLMKWSSS